MAEVNKEVAVKISGDGTSLSSAWRQAAGATASGVDSITGKLGSLDGALNAVQERIGAFAGLVIVGAVAALHQFADAFANSVESTRDMARGLGITTNEVAALQAAMGNDAGEIGEYTAAMRGLQRQLRTNEDALKAYGLQTRDANGNMRSMQALMNDSIGLLNQYKSGTDRSVMSAEFFGRAIDSSSRLLLLNAEAFEQGKAIAEEFSLTIGKDATDAWNDYDNATDRATMALKGIGKAIGESVLPIFTNLATWLGNIAPAAINVLRVALGTLTTAFLTLTVVVRTFWEVLNAMVISVADPILQLGKALISLVNGDLSGAVAAVQSIPGNIADAWGNAGEKIRGTMKTTAEEIRRVWSPMMNENGGGVGDTGSADGNKAAKVIPKKTATDKEQNRMGQWEATLAEEKVYYQKSNDLREMSKEQELAYWEDIKQRTDLTANERIAVTRRVAQTELAIMKDAQQERMQLSELDTQDYVNSQNSRIEARRQQAQFDLAIGRINAEEMIRVEQQLEDERFAIQMEAVRQRIALLENDPTKNAVALRRLNDELLQIEREHELKKRGLSQEAALEQVSVWSRMAENVGGSFGSVINGLVTRTMTLRQAVMTLFSGLLSSVSNFLGQMLAKKLATWAAEKALGTAQIGMEAAKAGAGAAASQASIPIAGPGLALAAMAAVFGAVMGLGRSVPSARGGFDIPAGVNPMTQLHEREMVLPQEQADAVRDMATGGNNGAPIQFKGTSAGDFFIAHKREIAKLMNTLNRDFEFVR